MPTINISWGCFRATSKLKLVLLTFFAWSGFDKPYLFTGVFLQGYYFIQNFYNFVLSTVSDIFMSFCSLGLEQPLSALIKHIIILALAYHVIFALFVYGEYTLCIFGD